VSTFALEYYGLFRGATMFGVAKTFGTVNAKNTDVSELSVWVNPPHHGQGLHRHLFDHVDAIERSRWRTCCQCWGDVADRATRSFWEAELGDTLAFNDRGSPPQGDRPYVQGLDTGNADWTPAMLAINEAMGFRHILHHGVWHKIG
jgi:GNAT superfamily N-acetyltransferase